MTCKHKVLVDLLPALEGFAGIPQESRLLFKTLAELDSTLEIGGLIYSQRIEMLRYHFKNIKNDTDKILFLSDYFSDLIHTIEHQTSNHSTSPSAALVLLRKLKSIVASFKKYSNILHRQPCELMEINTDHFFGFLWRTLFTKTLTPHDFRLLKKQRYLVSNLNTDSIRESQSIGLSTPLKTEGWDFIIFQFQRPVRVSPKTQKIIRYHDSIAFHDMDVTVHGSSRAHGMDLKQCMHDSFYVCNSEPTREDLCHIVPSLEHKSITIPPIIANYHKSLHRNTLQKIIQNYLSSTLLSLDAQKDLLNRLTLTPDFKYILILSTLEPRKNHLSVIKAWEELCANQDPHLKLMIVGSLGWKYTPILNAMRTHVLNGNIIHLEKVAPIDMGSLYSHAEAFLFPSFNEGFGSPPLEALQCDCPVILSDIKTHRWVYGDAALYCDPYNPSSLKDALIQLLYAEDRLELKEKMLRIGRDIIQRYSAETVRPQWEALFHQLKPMP